MENSKLHLIIAASMFAIAGLSVSTYISDRELVKSKKEVKDLTAQVANLERAADSLRDEAFTSHVELGRFEMALEIFLERNPKAAAEYSTIISEETE